MCKNGAGRRRRKSDWKGLGEREEGNFVEIPLVEQGNGMTSALRSFHKILVEAWVERNNLAGRLLAAGGSPN